MTVSAEVHSDDFVFKVSFDATSWFERAPDKAIVDLIACGFGGDYPADEVALSYEESNSDIGALMDYCRGQSEVGFECHVHEPDAEIWLRERRPHLLPKG